MHPLDALALYRDLAPAEKTLVDAHLAECATCRATLAAYQQQDAALAQLPRLRPRQRPRPVFQAAAPHPIARLGNAVALGSLTVLVVALVLGAQTGSGLVPASPDPLPGYTLPPSTVQAPTPWTPALLWLGGAGLVVGLLFTFTRAKWPPLLGTLLSGMLLISFVPPFSAVPNPAGVYWRLVGGYSYDPRLPFKNDMLIAGRPEQQLEPYLKQLLGQTGLSPLDPVQPLARYEILRVSLHPRKNRTALVTTRFIYADGSSRIYPVPLMGPVADVFGFYLAGWRTDGLERTRSIHLALPQQPFATGASAIQLGEGQWLATLHPAAHRLDEANPYHWVWDSVRLQRLVYAPDSSAFLAVIEQDATQRTLWHVPLNGSPPNALAVGDVREYGWSPDSRTVLYTRLDPDAAALDPTHPYAIVAVPATTSARSDVDIESPSRLAPTSGQLVTSLNTAQLPGLTAEGAWFFSEGALWLAPYDGTPAQRLTTNLQHPTLAPRPAPDGQTFAYACGVALCLAWRDGSLVGEPQPMNVAEIAWHPAGKTLAIVDRDPNDLRPVRVVVLWRFGGVRWAGEVAPRDVTDAPQWTPDANALFIQTYPQKGRRLIAIDLPTGQVIDLSRERWDTYFALAPNGYTLLLNNGRGGFWQVPVVR